MTLDELLESGQGAVIRFEDLPRGLFKEMDTLAGELEGATGLEATAHLYLGKREGSRALQPHTDPCTCGWKKRLLLALPVRIPSKQTLPPRRRRLCSAALRQQRVDHMHSTAIPNRARHPGTLA